MLRRVTRRKMVATGFSHASKRFRSAMPFGMFFWSHVRGLGGVQLMTVGMESVGRGCGEQDDQRGGPTL
jgi:hypothetical protein